MTILADAPLLTPAQIGELASSLDGLHGRVLKVIDRLQKDVEARKKDIASRWKSAPGVSAGDLARFGLDETAIAKAQWSAQWAALLDFQTERARALMLEGAPLVRQLPGRMGWEIRLTVQGGLRILDQIRRARGDVFRQRPVLRPSDWLRIGSRALFM